MGLLERQLEFFLLSVLAPRKIPFETMIKIKKLLRIKEATIGSKRIKRHIKYT